jgi:choice-of-anchor A domain-containing protein
MTRLGLRRWLSQTGGRNIKLALSSRKLRSYPLYVEQLEDRLAPGSLLSPAIVSDHFWQDDGRDPALAQAKSDGSALKPITPAQTISPLGSVISTTASDPVNTGTQPQSARPAATTPAAVDLGRSSPELFSPLDQLFGSAASPRGSASPALGGGTGGGTATHENLALGQSQSVPPAISTAMSPGANNASPSGPSPLLKPLTSGSLCCGPLAQPVITDVSRDTGIGGSGSTTTDPTLVLYGTASPDSTLTIKRADIGVLGTTVADVNGNWRFDYTGTTLANGTYTFTATAAGFGPLGVANDFNAFVFEYDTQTNTEARGRVAVGENANFTNYGVGSQLTNSNGTRDDLIVDGNVSFHSGQMYNGNLAYVGTASFSSLGFLNNSAPHQQKVLDFAGAQSYLTSASTSWAALTANGTVTDQYGSLTLTGTDPALNVFSLSTSLLSSANGLTINAPAGSIALVNVTGTTGKFQNMGVNLQGVDYNHVLFNFSQATSLVIQAISVEGSVLAPLALVNFTNGNIDGTVVADSLCGSGELHNHPFVNNCPSVDSSPFTITVSATPDAKATKFFLADGASPASDFRCASDGSSSIAHAPFDPSNSQPRGVASDTAGDTQWSSMPAARSLFTTRTAR